MELNNEKKIIEERAWNMFAVRDVCIHENWYTCGTSKQYDNMLWYVENNEPNGENLFKVACDILVHTDKDQGQTIENIMFILCKDACCTFFTVE